MFTGKCRSEVLMGGLIDTIAGLACRMRPDSPDEPYEGREAAHTFETWVLR
jgi:hypothetical protein